MENPKKLSSFGFSRKAAVVWVNIVQKCSTFAQEFSQSKSGVHDEESFVQR